jgi:hypothetical protein
VRARDRVGGESIARARVVTPNGARMKKAIVIGLSLFASIGVASAQDANQDKFEKECAPLIAKGGPCADVPKGEGRRRACVAKPENLEKAPAGCKAAIKEWEDSKKK